MTEDRKRSPTCLICGSTYHKKEMHDPPPTYNPYTQVVLDADFAFRVWKILYQKTASDTDETIADELEKILERQKKAFP